MTNKKPYEIVGPVERFDQKNEMFKRSRWDPVMKEHSKKFYGWRKQLGLAVTDECRRAGTQRGNSRLLHWDGFFQQEFRKHN